jgi:protoporphyrinogen oxidase
VNVAVVGGGLAGLSAATRLADRGHAVTLFERRTRLEAEGDEAPELLVGGHRSLDAFLQRIGCAGALARHELTLCDGESRRAPLRAAPLPAPLGVVGGLAGFAALTLRDRVALLRLAAALARPSAASAPSDWETAGGWLTRLGQPPSAQRVLLAPLARAVLGDDPATASAKMLEAVLRGAEDLDVALLAPSAIDRIAAAARSAIEARGGRVRTGAPVVRVRIVDGRARGVELPGGERHAADAVVLAVGPAEVLALVPAEVRRGETYFDGIGRLGHAPSVAVHLWLDRPVMVEPLIGLVERPFDWIAHRRSASGQTQLSLISVGARTLVERPADELVALAVTELQRAVPEALCARVEQARAVRRPEARVAHDAGAEGNRPRCRTPVDGLVLAARWVRTGLPPSVESAARAASEAVELLAAYRPPEPAATARFVPVARLRKSTLPTA